MTEQQQRADLPPDRFTALWRRMKDHRIAQWTVGYVAVAYGIQHAITLTSEAFDWPHAVTRVSMLLLVLGVPLAMTLAWYHGERASRRVSGPELTIISILLVVGSLVFYALVGPSGEVAAGPKPAVRQASVATPPASPGQAGISLAVLPFVNLSGDASQEFFSDGMTEEITAALAKIPGLTVVARTSAFAFKGENKDMRAIGTALGASHLIEGSVRKDGNEVRITAQLIKVRDGTHLWTESYDRELKGVFAVQEQIAEAIAGALKVPLGLESGGRLISSRTEDLGSYEQFLHARALLRARTVDVAVATLEKVVATDPNYAPAWGLLARSYSLLLAYNGASRESSVEAQRQALQSTIEKIDKAGREAVRLDDKQPLGYLGLARAVELRGNYLAADGFNQRALALDPTNPEVLDSYSQMLFRSGRLKESLLIREQLRSFEPFVPVFNIVTAQYLAGTGQNEAAIRLLEAVPPETDAVVTLRNLVLADAYAKSGRYMKAADTLLAIPASQNRVSRRSLEDAARLLRSVPAKVSSGSLPAFNNEANFVYAYVGAENRVLEWPESYQKAERNSAIGISNLWSPRYAPLRKTERFKSILRNAGLVDYWRAKGWPDLCHPVGADDFECS